MARLTDPERLKHYTTVLKLWSYDCYIHWKAVAAKWVRGELGITLREFGRLMHEHVAGGGKIDEVPETRPEYRDAYEFHHDLRFSVPSGRKVYVETVLEMDDRDPEDSTIMVVNVHDQ